MLTIYKIMSIPYGFFIKKKKRAGNINLESVKSESLFFLLHTMSSKFLFNISLIK